MTRSVFKVFCCGLLLTSLAVAQMVGLTASVSKADLLPPYVSTYGDASQPVAAILSTIRPVVPPLSIPTVLPRMAPELALETYERRAALQSAELVSYSATTVIRAELPETSQSGEFELQRMYTAPRSLVFKALRFTGDSFVKSNIITRLLQSEVDHVQKDDRSLTALNSANYKFSYKGSKDLEGHLVHVYQVKPRKKRVGLFKGHIYLDVHTGSLVRAEGTAVKSPSFFVKKIEFVQDYAEIDGFTFPVHTHSEARARLVGRAIVDIYQRDYRPMMGMAQANPPLSSN